MSRIMPVIKAIARFMLRPFTAMWPMVAAMLVLLVRCKLISHQAIDITDSLAELYVLMLVLSLLRGRWLTAVSSVILSAYALLVVIETFLISHFKLSLADDVFQLMLGSSTTETSQFLDTFVFTSSTHQYVSLLITCIIVALCLYRYKDRIDEKVAHASTPMRTTGTVALLLAALGIVVWTGWMPKQARLARLLQSTGVYDYELRYIDVMEHGGLIKTAPTRLAQGYCLYRLTTHQCDEIMTTAQSVAIDSCNHTSPGIMLLLGESSIRRHLQIYGYQLPTTPRQLQEMQSGNLTVIGDALTVTTETSEVMKGMLSMHSVDQKGSWTSSPMLPHLMKLGGYRVSFVTNQYDSESHNIWNNTGGFFMRDKRTSKLLFDYHTPHSYTYDEGLLGELQQAIPGDSEYNFTLFHVLGQHIPYEARYPENRVHFSVKDYASRTDLNDEQKQQVAHYDNSTYYQDSICGALFDRFADKDMVIVFVSDHGENVYDDGHTMGRVHNDLSKAMVESQYQVPMWIWCSPKYRMLHPDMYELITQAACRPFQTDDMPHLILALAGVHCKYLDPARCLINPAFNTHRQRKAAIK